MITKLLIKYFIYSVNCILFISMSTFAQQKLNKKIRTTVLKDRYIVFFLENVEPTKVDSVNYGKDANTNYSFVGELPYLFGPINKGSQYKYAFGLVGPMLLTQSVRQMQNEVNTAFDIAERNNVPVYFQLDDCNNYTTQFGGGANPKFYENSDWSEWVAFPKDTESWGGESYGRLPYFWYNWGSWAHADAFPCYESPGFRKFVISQLQNGVLNPLVKRYQKLVSEGKEYLFAGMAIGWETHIPDYSLNNTILNVNLQNLPVTVVDTMKQWEAAEYGYNSLYLKGYKTYNLQALDTVIHDYSELLAKTAYEAGIPKQKIFTHMVGFISSNSNLHTTFAPPIWAAVNQYSIPGFTLSPVTCPYNLDTLVTYIKKTDSSQNYFACAEGYSRGVDQSISQAYNYFNSMFSHGAAFVSVLGWGMEGIPPSYSAFVISHSPSNPFVIAAKTWMNSFNNKKSNLLPKHNGKLK